MICGIKEYKENLIKFGKGWNKRNKTVNEICYGSKEYNKMSLYIILNFCS